MGMMSEIDIILRNGDTAKELADWLLNYSKMDNNIDALKIAEQFIKEAKENKIYGRRYR